MNTLQASQKNRRERIADAMRIEWNGYTDSYSADLWLCLESLMRKVGSWGVHWLEQEPIYFGGSKHTLTLTQLEDLCELVRRSYHEQQEAKAVR